MSVMQYLRIAAPIAEALHIPNGGYRRAFEASILKGMGVKAGCPDILIMWPIGKSAFIELKAPDSKGRLSESQKTFHEKLKILGIPCTVCTSIESVGDFLRSIGVPMRETMKRAAI